MIEEKNTYDDSPLARFTFRRIARYWYLYLIFVIIAIAAIFFIKKQQTALYESYTTVFIKGQKMDFNQAAMISGVGLSASDISKEIAILQSYTMKERTLKALDLSISYLKKNKYKTIDIYKNAPFTIEVDKAQPQMVNVPYNLHFIDEKTFYIETETDGFNTYDLVEKKVLDTKLERFSFSGEYHFDEWIETGTNSFRVLKNEQFTPFSMRGDYIFIINSWESIMANNGVVTIEHAIDENSTIINIKTVNQNAQKSVDYVNTLAQEFIRRELEIKNDIFNKTIAFIDDKMNDIRDSLQSSELDLKKFQKQNSCIDLDEQAKKIIEDASSWEAKLNESKFSIKYYNILRDYITSDIDDANKILAPSVMGVADPVLNNLVAELVNLTAQKTVLLQTSTEKSPYVMQINEQIRQTKTIIDENIDNLITNTNLYIDNINHSLDSLDKISAQMPEAQQQLLNFKRKYAFNESLYDFLIKRRSETDLVRASNVPDTEIIDEARLETTFPINNSNKIAAVIILFAFILPTIYVIFRIIIVKKVEDEDDLPKLDNAPIIGRIPLCRVQNDVRVVFSNPKSGTTEAFRSLFTNIKYMMQGKDQGVILVSSDMMGVGKTFISINLASVYSLFGKKTLLVGLDLRKPRLFKEFNLNNDHGISSYLSGRDDVNDIIQHSSNNENLDIITAGPTPPNPAELIASEKTSKLFEQLRQQYDYIIVDSAPLALVTDTYALLHEADVVAYIVRLKVSHRDIVEQTLEDLHNRTGKSTALIFNGMKLGKTSRYGHKYGYGYGYGYSDKE